MTPVEFASRAIVHLSAQPNSAGRTFHLVNPRPTSWAALGDFVAHGATRSGRSRWPSGRIEANAVVGQGLEKSMFAWLPLVRALTTADGPLVLPQLRYDCTHTLHGLKGTAISCPPADEHLLGVYFDQLVRSGVIHSSSKLAGDDGRVSAGLRD